MPGKEKLNHGQTIHDREHQTYRINCELNTCGGRQYSDRKVWNDPPHDDFGEHSLIDVVDCEGCHAHNQDEVAVEDVELDAVATQGDGNDRQQCDQAVDRN